MKNDNRRHFQNRHTIEYHICESFHVIFFLKLHNYRPKGFCFFKKGILREWITDRIKENFWHGWIKKCLIL